MSTKNKVLVAIAVIIISIALTVLVLLGLLDVDPLIGLFGVIIGALIVEFSHHQSARDERRHQLRLAALDRRLQAHQEAFSLWRRLMRDLGDQVKLSQTVLDCQEWWNNNCLYLAADARQAFSHAYMTAATHYASIAAGEKELVLYETQVIQQAGNRIVQGVELPTISEGEDREIKRDSRSDA
jgi:hypothetical protein